MAVYVNDIHGATTIYIYMYLDLDLYRLGDLDRAKTIQNTITRRM